MRKIFIFLTILLALGNNNVAQSVAQQRAERMGTGMNVSYLENWWGGTKSKHYSDFAKPEEAAKREKMFAEIAKAGFKTVRIPINFSAWMELKQPYNWDNPNGLELADNFVKWALANNLNVIIDLHHLEFDRSIPEAETAERIVNLWVKIAERYKNTDPEKVFFEIRNEPRDITAEGWRWQAEQIIKYIREIDKKHTLIVGFEEWNSRQTMIKSKPFADDNIIYTFHYYDPFIFTHQGATWAGSGLVELRNIPFPYSSKEKIKVPKTGGPWVEGMAASYEKDSNSEKIFADLKEAKDWSVKNKVPIFLGEFGSYNQYSTLESRCRHAQVIYSALGKLKIPNAWWEWDGGFNMFKKETPEIADCMRKAIDSYGLPEASN
ncbi:MAG: glycoside hydrolase family 5 protein [Pyrinomonadaceae bacterium]|nr:glycoside hydrolase family 5 protein [Pyrinomonadaceae bacterium]